MSRSSRVSSVVPVRTSSPHTAEAEATVYVPVPQEILRDACAGSIVNRYRRYGAVLHVLRIEEVPRGVGLVDMRVCVYHWHSVHLSITLAYTGRRGSVVSGSSTSNALR